MFDRNSLKQAVDLPNSKNLCVKIHNKYAGEDKGERNSKMLDEGLHGELPVS